MRKVISEVRTGDGDCGIVDIWDRPYVDLSDGTRDGVVNVGIEKI